MSIVLIDRHAQYWRFRRRTIKWEKCIRYCTAAVKINFVAPENCGCTSPNLVLDCTRLCTFEEKSLARMDPVQFYLNKMFKDHKGSKKGIFSCDFDYLEENPSWLNITWDERISFGQIIYYIIWSIHVWFK